MKNNIFHLNLKEDVIDTSFIEKEKQQQIVNNSISNNSICSDDTSSEIKLCESPFIYHKEKYLVDIEQNKILSLYSTFKYLKVKYELKNTRKNRIDCIIKKVKTKYLKAIHETLKYCVNIYIHRLPQYFVSNIKIEFNKKYFNKTLEQIYTEFKILPSLSELIERNQIKKGKKEILILLMNSPLKDIYKYYLSSDLYKYYRMYIKKKEGENIAKLYDYVAQNICEYFIYNKGNKKKISLNNNNNTINNINYGTKIINNNKIIIQNNVKNNTFQKSNCINNMGDNNFEPIIDNNICKRKIKFKIQKTK